MKRLGVLLFVCCLLAMPALGQEIVLELWDGITGPDGDGIQALVDRFNREHAGEIRVHRMPAGWDELYTKVYVAVAGGVAPDILIMHRDRLPEQVLAGTLSPIDRYYGELGLTDEDFLPGLAEEGVFEGQRYGIPLDVHPLALYYNAEHFLQAGIGGPPADSGEFRQYARLLTQRASGDTVTRWGARIADGGTQYYSILGQFGADLFGGPGYEVPLPDEEAALAALQYMYDMFHVEGTVHPWAWLFSQESSMMIDGIWFLPELERMRESGMNIKVAPADRVFGDVRPAIWAGSHMFTFPRQRGEDPQRIRAALRFVNWMSQNSLEWATWGQLPARRDVVSDPDFLALTEHLVFAQQQFHFFPPTPWGTGGGHLMDMGRRIIFDRMSPGTVLEQAIQGLKVFVEDRRKEVAQ